MTRRRLRALLAAGAGYAGTLAELCHEEFVEMVRSHGGRYVRYSNHARMALLVIGEASLPITLGGEPIELSARVVMAESEFRRAMGDEGHAPLRYSLRSMAELLKVPRARIGAWVKAGLIAPAVDENGVERFDFRQVALARHLCDLAGGGVSIARLRGVLLRLRRMLPHLEEPLHQLSMLEANGPMLVRLEHGELAEIDGQLRLSFDDAGASEPLPVRLHNYPGSGRDWHERGIEQEIAGQFEEAEDSYRQALRAGGPDAQICFDLASLLARMGRPAEAIERYQQVIEIDPGHADAWNNLGVLMMEKGEWDRAAEAFGACIRLDSTCASAHFNLADMLDAQHPPGEAAEHWRAFLRSCPEPSLYSAYAKQKLRNE